MATEAPEDAPRDLDQVDQHTSLSMSGTNEHVPPEPNRADSEPAASEPTASEHVTIQVQDDQNVPETKIMTVEPAVRNSIDISMDLQFGNRDRQMSSSLTDRTRTSSKNLFVQQPSLTQLSTTVSTAVSDTQTGTTATFPEMTTSMTGTETPTTPQSDSESKPQPDPIVRPESHAERVKPSPIKTKPKPSNRPMKRNPERVQREIYRKYRNTIRRTRKSHICIVAFAVYLGLLAFVASFGIACVCIALTKNQAGLAQLGILFAAIAIDCLLSLVGELSLFVRALFRWRADSLEFNAQLYFIFQLARRPIVMGSLAVFWWFHLQNTGTGGWTFSGRGVFILMAFLGVWEVFVLYMQWDEHALYILLSTYDAVRSLCGAVVNTDEETEDDDEGDFVGDNYDEFGTDTPNETPRSSNGIPLDYHLSLVGQDSPGKGSGKKHSGDSESTENVVSPKKRKAKAHKSRGHKSRGHKSKSMEITSSEEAARSRARSRSRSRSRSRENNKSVRSRINDTGQIQIISIENSKRNYLLSDGSGPQLQEVSLSNRSSRKGKWKAPPRRSKSPERREEGSWQSQRSADRDRKRRSGGGRPNSRRPASPLADDELHYRKKDTITINTGSGRKRKKKRSQG